MSLFIDIGEDGVIIVGFGNVVNEFLNEYSFVDIGIIEKINFFILGVGSKEVNDFDISFENFSLGRLVNEGGGVGVDRGFFDIFDRIMLVNGLIDDVYDMIVKLLVWFIFLLLGCLFI